jgi:hypothetical protein
MKLACFSGMLFLSSMALVNKVYIGQFINQGSNPNQGSDTTAYFIVQVPPEFTGGNEALLRFIQSTASSNYPISAKKGKGTYTVFLKLLIEKDGSISNLSVQNADTREEYIREGKRIARSMPKWKPGSQDGRLLRAYTVVPIHFIIEKKP